MATITVSVHIPLPPERVWAEVERVEDHPAWMTDAVGLEFDGDLRRGIGTRVRVATRVGPFRTTDLLEFTEWDPPATMGVAHRGLFRGTGAFRLRPEAGGTRLEWSERVEFPWFLGGPLGAFVARPVLERIWRANLLRLRERLGSAPG